MLTIHSEAFANDQESLRNSLDALYAMRLANDSLYEASQANLGAANGG